MTFSPQAYWQNQTLAHLDTAQKTFAALEKCFTEILKACAGTIQNSGKIMFCGNGGSAGDAQHLACELSVKFKKDRSPIAALALATDYSTMTATGNDYGFDQLFARQIDALGHPHDALIALSTSGRSANIIQALKTAKEQNITTIGFSGRDGGAMPELCDHCLIVPSDNTARIQEMHITLGHMLCGALEQKLGLV